MDSLISYWFKYTSSCLPWNINYLTNIANVFSLCEVVTLENCRVRIIRQLETGGTADVFLVEDDAATTGARNQQFALKKMQCNTEEQLKNARAEIELMRRALHPGVVTLVDAKITAHEAQPSGGSATGIATAWILMPFYRTGTVWDVVHSRLAARSPLTPSEMLCILQQLVASLEALHGLGLVHRDVKPQNLLLENLRDTPPEGTSAGAAPTASTDPKDPWRCALTDFGSTCSSSDLQVSTFEEASRVLEDAERMCSPLYRPPELYDVPTPSKLDGRIDVWAVGCLLYFMMMGESPFESALSKGASMVLAVHRARISWDSPPAPLNPDLVELANACLRPNYVERPTSKELHERIRQLRQQLARNAL